MTTNNTFGPTGVAITGGNVTGDVTGTAIAQGVGVPAELVEALRQLRTAIESSDQLTAEQKEDQSAAVADVESEAQKPDGERNKSRVRISLGAIARL